MKVLRGVLAGIMLLQGVVQAQSVDVKVDSSPTVTVDVSNNIALLHRGEKSIEITIDQDEPVRSKTITKTFAVDRSDKLMLSNQYGSIQIKTWDRNEIKADIDVKAFSSNEGDAQELLDQVTIESGKSGDQVFFRTKLNQNRNMGSGSRNGRRWRREVRVNYIVYMPAANAVNLSQTYGNITMPSISGAVYAKVQYGNFTAESLNNTNNYISVEYGNSTIQRLNSAVVKQQYGSGLTIGSVGTLDLDAQYSAVNLTTIRGNATIKQQYGSGLTIGSVENLDLDVQYASVNINTIRGNAQIEQQYNSLAIGSVGKLSLDAQYTSATIGTLRGDGNFDMQYNKLSIGEVTTGCKALSVNAAYVGINIGFNDNYNAEIDVHTNYAGFKFADGVAAKITGTGRDSSSKDYTGKIGNGGTSRVRINSDYGSVTFK